MFTNIGEWCIGIAIKERLMVFSNDVALNSRFLWTIKFIIIKMPATLAPVTDAVESKARNSMK